MKSQPPTIAKDGTITCPNCGARWNDWNLMRLLDYFKRWWKP